MFQLFQIFDRLLQGSSTKHAAKRLIENLLEDEGLSRKPKKLQLLRELYPGMIEAFDEALDSILQRGDNPTAVGNLAVVRGWEAIIFICSLSICLNKDCYDWKKKSFETL